MRLEIRLSVKNGIVVHNWTGDCVWFDANARFDLPVSLSDLRKRFCNPWLEFSDCSIVQVIVPFPCSADCRIEEINRKAEQALCFPWYIKDNIHFIFRFENNYEAIVRKVPKIKMYFDLYEPCDVVERLAIEKGMMQPGEEWESVVYALYKKVKSEYYFVTVPGGILQIPKEE